MLACIQSYLLQGIDGLRCEVEVDFDEGSGSGNENRNVVVGLPDAAVKESLERVRSALANSGYFLPNGRALINLAPADVRKEGPLYDLPIAIGLLVTQGVIVAGRGGARRDPAAPAQRVVVSEVAAGGVDLRRYLIAGELALDGRVRPVKGAIAMAALAASLEMQGVIVPAENAAEAAVVPGVEVLGVRTLSEVVGILKGEIEAHPEPTPDIEAMLRTAAAPVDFAEVRGQEAVKRAIVVAAAGGHNLLQLWSRACHGGWGPPWPAGHKSSRLWSSDCHGARRRPVEHRLLTARLQFRVPFGEFTTPSRKCGGVLVDRSALPDALGSGSEKPRSCGAFGA